MAASHVTQRQLHGPSGQYWGGRRPSYLHQVEYQQTEYHCFIYRLAQSDFIKTNTVGLNSLTSFGIKVKNWEIKSERKSKTKLTLNFSIEFW